MCELFNPAGIAWEIADTPNKGYYKNLTIEIQEELPHYRTGLSTAVALVHQADVGLVYAQTYASPLEARYRVGIWCRTYERKRNKAFWYKVLLLGTLVVLAAIAFLLRK